MKLHYSAASPYVRKVRVVARECGLEDEIENIEGATSPIAPNQALAADNPVAKVPTLVLDDGSTLYDSRVIAEYLDSLHDGPRLFPEAGPARWTALRRQALADAILDAGIITRYETFLRPEALRWEEWIAGQKGKVSRGLDVLEGEADDFADTVDIATIAIACALEWLDFRYGEDDWRSGRPRLAAWLEGFAARPSMRATRPEG